MLTEIMNVGYLSQYLS